MLNKAYMRFAAASELSGRGVVESSPRRPELMDASDWNNTMKYQMESRRARNLEPVTQGPRSRMHSMLMQQEMQLIRYQGLA